MSGSAAVKDRVERALACLVRGHASLLPGHVTELSDAPTALEFSRFVAANKPVVVRNAAKRSRTKSVPDKALSAWTNEHLVDRMRGTKVAIAVSPDGRADSVNDDDIFVEPATIDLTMEEFLDKLDPPHDHEGPVYYLQSQNGNLGDEYKDLRDDVGSDGPRFAREAFGAPPDVSNIWIGDDRSVTSLHKDPYENIYFVVRGSKTFHLLQPTASYALEERDFPHAKYKFDARMSAFGLVLSSPDVRIPWTRFDPAVPRRRAVASSTSTSRTDLANTIEVTLEPGDMLYLPAMWYHQVSQSVGPPPPPPPASPSPSSQTGESHTLIDSVRHKHAAIAVNWWYDMDMSAPLWSLMQFVRKTTLAVDCRPDHEPDDSDDD